MLVTSQLPIQITKIFHRFFDLHLCLHFQKGVSTTAHHHHGHDYRALCWDQ